MDDGGKQVSWLVAEVRASPSRQAASLGSRGPTSGFWRAANHLQLRGQPGFHTRFPLNPLTGNLSRGARMKSAPAIVKGGLIFWSKEAEALSTRSP